MPVAVGTLVLVAASFGVGRATATSSNPVHAPTVPTAPVVDRTSGVRPAPGSTVVAAPAASTSTSPSTSVADEYICRLGRPC